MVLCSPLGRLSLEHLRPHVCRELRHVLGQPEFSLPCAGASRTCGTLLAQLGALQLRLNTGHRPCEAAEPKERLRFQLVTLTLPSQFSSSTIWASRKLLPGPI